MAKVFHALDAAVSTQLTWDERWEGADRGLLCSWSRGVEKARDTPLLSEQALRGELPPLAWKGGADKPIKAGKRVGSLQYLATWQGVRGEPLDIDTDALATLTCSAFKTVVTFTGDMRALALASGEES
ncbi:MAG: hypothetical protein EOP02_15595 [Proteobacteria bacterium]|nr:MAG: hypothetical protein EOP02_15595 [Pseudomonadota bacterium]